MSNRKLIVNPIDFEDTETVDPDEIDIDMIEEAERINDETYITLEEIAEKPDIKNNRGQVYRRL